MLNFRIKLLHYSYYAYIHTFSFIIKKTRFADYVEYSPNNAVEEHAEENTDETSVPDENGDLNFDLTLPATHSVSSQSFFEFFDIFIQ